MMSARSLQDVVVCAHHGCAFVEAWLADAAITDAERRAFRAVDPRAFRADNERRHRAVTAIADELPVSIAIAGLPAVYALFDDEGGFGAVVRGRTAMAVQFAACLVPRAGDMARIEGAIARARRARAPGPAGVVRAAGVEVVEVQPGSLEAHQAARAALGGDPVTEVCGGRRLPAPPEAPGRVWLLVSHAPASTTVATCSEALGRLLDGCGAEADDAFVARARTLGCDTDDEARELLADLLADGLLTRR